VSRPTFDHLPAIKAVMTPFPYFIDVDRPLDEARQLMREHQIRHLPVQRGERLVGVISDRDLRLVEGSAPDAAARGHLSVRDACVYDPFTVDLETPLDRVALEMAQRHIGSAIVTRHGKLAGIFTVTDACRVLGTVLREMFPRGGDDAA
jgi:CBS domain-containing protein